MAGLTLDQFGKALSSVGLLDTASLKACWASLSASERPKDATGLADLLIARKTITQFQADSLLAGRGGSLVMGDYLLLSELGAGGMGKVYKARHKRMERIVALKVMSAAAMSDEASVKRFQREVKAAARLEHPNIVTAYDSGETGNVKYLVMQFVEGGDLSQHVKANGPLEIERAVDYVLQAARGLAFAHGEGIIHRDIKPANLLLDKKGVVKILDMGLARIESGDDGLTATEQVMGTVDYMSPEQASNTKGADARADIYSLGCTLWFLLTAKKLYDGDTMISRLMAHRDGPLPSLVKARDDASWPLEQVFHRMIAKRPQDRFQSMDEVVAALEPFGSSGGGSSSGRGSSIGMGSGPQDAEFASFLKSVDSGAKPQAKPMPSGTQVEAEATVRFVGDSVETDPKSEVLSPKDFAPKPVPARTANARAQAPRRNNKPPVKLVAGGLGGLVLFALLGVIVAKVFDKDGNEAANANVPAGNGETIVAVARQPTTSTAVLPSPPSFSTNATASPSIFAAPPPVAVVPPPPGDYALLFNLNDAVEFDVPIPYTVDACTVEAFVRLDAITPSGVVCAISEGGMLGLNPTGESWAMRHYKDPAADTKGGHYGASSNLPAEVGRRIHLAGVYDSDAFRLYVDGKLTGRSPPRNTQVFTLGKKPPRIGSQFKGTIDEVRISKVVRYSDDFTPESRHEPDADTLALYHFDEGVGVVLHDASGHNRHGRIVNAKWVKADGSAIGTSAAAE